MATDNSVTPKSNTPPSIAVDAIEDGTASILRRMEIMEHDGVTPWSPDSEKDNRFITGGVNVDYGRDERRTLDITLRNNDNLLHPDPIQGFWYDKVIKLYRGVKWSARSVQPRIVIVEAGDNSTTVSNNWKNQLKNLGYQYVDIKFDIEYRDVADYDVYVATGSASQSIQYPDILRTAFNDGKAVFTIDGRSTSVQIPFIVSSSGGTTQTAKTIKPSVRDNPLSGSFVTETNASTFSVVPIASHTGIEVAYDDTSGSSTPRALLGMSSSGGRWFHMHTSPSTTGFGAQMKLLVQAGVSWIRNYQEDRKWETQVGEFCIDNITGDNFPNHLKVTGRDYTKRCLLSKLERAKAFEAGTSVRELIAAVATNAGITKLKLPEFGLTLDKRMDYAAYTPRWQIMKEIAQSFSYDVYFDSSGYLTMTAFPDPALGASIVTFKTGVKGNLVKYTRSTNDSELFNHLVVTSGDPGADIIPFFGEAINNDPTSPTNIARIGDRMAPEIVNSALDSNQKCKDLALSLLKYFALESYEFSFDSICYPWLDVGVVSDVIDPYAIDTDPTRYLLDTLEIPMALGPMSSTAKRVTVVAEQ